MGFTSKIRAMVNRARTELDGVTWPPSPAQREADNRAHDDAERRNTTGN